MILKNNNLKIKIDLLTKISTKIKSFKFKLTDIENGICFPKKKILNTYLFCQKVDVIFTNKNNKVLKVLNNVDSEKIIFGPKKTFYIYILKNNSINDIKSDDILSIDYTKEELQYLKRFQK